MKKLLGALLIGVFALAAASQAQLSIGVDGAVAAATVVPASGANSLAVRYDFAGGIVGKLGLNYASSGGASATGYGVQVAYLLPQKLGATSPLVGVVYNSNGAAAATNNIALILGAEVEIAKGVLFSAGITPYNSATTGGATTATTSTGMVWYGLYVKL